MIATIACAALAVATPTQAQFNPDPIGPTEQKISLSCPLDTSIYQRAESWVSGAQPNRTSCDESSPLISGACVQSTQKSTATRMHEARICTEGCSTTRGASKAMRSGTTARTSCHGGCDNHGAEEEEPGCEDAGTCEEEPGGGNTPILIPLTRAQRYALTSVAEGVQFDLDADGTPEQTAWTAGDSRLAFLAIDRNNNGVIDNGSELFGNHTVAGASNGFLALQNLMPLNGSPGWIDDDDPIYPKLLLWEDRNHNGRSEADELQLAGNVLTRIGLGYSAHARRDGAGNQFRYRGWAEVRTQPGHNPVAGGADHQARRIDIYDVIFVR